MTSTLLPAASFVTGADFESLSGSVDSILEVEK